jgi:7-carboxy-7-deazaguanine synthase
VSETLGIGGILPSRHTRQPTIPIAEVFGPTIQGEGPLAGCSTLFVRVGGCDYTCSWCDSMHAVDPVAVRKLPRLTAAEVLDDLMALPGAAQWVTISGGNPSMYAALGALVDGIHSCGLKVAVETQGSRWKDWLARVDQLVISPKPPSSGMLTSDHVVETERFLNTALDHGVLKFVVFDDADYVWATDFIGDHDGWPAWLSCGTDSQGAEELAATAARYRWLCERFAADDRPWLHRRTRVLPQLHVIAWVHKLGV